MQKRTDRLNACMAADGRAHAVSPSGRASHGFHAIFASRRGMMLLRDHPRRDADFKDLTRHGHSQVFRRTPCPAAQGANAQIDPATSIR